MGSVSRGYSGTYQSYLDDEVLQADPLMLVAMLYRGAVRFIDEAREHLAGKRIRERVTAVNRALAIVQELTISLRHEAGGTLSQNLASLYDYIARLLLDANARQMDAPLTEARRLLAELQDGWEQVAREQGNKAAAAGNFGGGDEPVGARFECAA